jgi:predicted acylesterase/phospholipase RssA
MGRPVSGGADDARRRLFGFWRDLEAHDPLDAAMNYWAVQLAGLPITAEISPYSYGPVAEPKLRDLLRSHLKLEDLPKASESRTHPSLILGATEILTGERTVFDGIGLTCDMVIASAAIPPLFRAVEIGDKRYWDGLFASNPPIRELTDLPNKPTEIWVVQINPQKRPEEPFSIRDINDRRNELAGDGGQVYIAVVADPAHAMQASENFHAGFARLQHRPRQCLVDHGRRPASLRNHDRLLHSSAPVPGRSQSYRPTAGRCRTPQQPRCPMRSATA